MSRHFCTYEAKVISLNLWKSEGCCHANAIVFKLQKARCESWPSYSLKRYYICEYLCHHTSLISEIHHSWGSFNSFWACTMMIMPFVFPDAVKGSKTYWNGYWARWHGGLGFSTIASRCCVWFPFSRESRPRIYMSDTCLTRNNKDNLWNYKNIIFLFNIFATLVLITSHFISLNTLPAATNTKRH